MDAPKWITATIDEPKWNTVVVGSDEKEPSYDDYYYEQWSTTATIDSQEFSDGDTTSGEYA